MMLLLDLGDVYVKHKIIKFRDASPQQFVQPLGAMLGSSEHTIYVVPDSRPASAHCVSVP